jgi:hypothetical protein
VIITKGKFFIFIYFKKLRFIFENKHISLKQLIYTKGFNIPYIKRTAAFLNKTGSGYGSTSRMLSFHLCQGIYAALPAFAVSTAFTVSTTSPMTAFFLKGQFFR